MAATPVFTPGSTAKPPLAPRPAATLILVRDGEQGLEVFLLQRTHQAAFVPGGYVFPGGAVDAADSDPFFASGLLDDAEASRRLGLLAGGLAYWTAAVRECYEEAGILLASDGQGRQIEASAPSLCGALEEARIKVAAGELAFADLCRSVGARPAFEELVYFAHWITPVGAPRRFDTRFFIGVAPANQCGSHDNGETIASMWLRPEDALARHRAGEVEMMFATVRTLQTLARFDSTSALMDFARAQTSVPTHQPRVSTGSKGRRVLIQGDAAYAEVGKLDPEGKGHAASDITPGEVTVLSRYLRRVTAPNPGFMTGPGTNSYLVGEGEELALIDPGPADAEHVAALLRHAGGRIRWILTTHTHIDHSPAAALVKAETGAQLLGMPAPAHGNQDSSFMPDVVPQDGMRIHVGDCTLRVIHTPGHASNHLCYLLEEDRILLTGDHVMQGSTVVINPPDGNMHAYLASLQGLKSLDAEYFAPGHGFLMANPHAVIDRIVAHRMAREEKIVKALAGLQEANLEQLLALAYDDVPPQRHAMAARSLLAHLEKLQADGRAVLSGVLWRPSGNGSAPQA
ncbi:MBL fold metallo-hydrolase [Noviherbaspirillum malthae]|jgi:glyoxylase-like metal-dependent hydrolase (beta-lactamase superfamily II)/8-oxo-dGTP pyrophosphatase MutT (NUDIX family)|uniref:MBL fold metallo-hydrolase n=1 Tax=Noviherbaspirillum malthae TaxID=1260987 RepID=UPI00189033A8|nr:MBL fold metallo-hydrolase [Noviherbaspirillum malthae]